MGINLENTDAKFQAIVAAGERSAQAARVRRVLDAVRAVAAEVGAKSATSLARRSRATGTSRKSSGRRYRADFVLYCCAPYDWDNAAGSVKEIQDQLVRQGWLPDGDGWRELEGTARAVKVAHKNEQRTEVKLTRLA